MKKLYLCALSLVLFMVAGLFTGCNGINTRFDFNPSVTEINIVLGETSSSTEGIDNSVVFDVEKKEAGDNDNVWLSVQNESIVSVRQVKNSNYKTEYKVTGLMPGTATLRVHSVIDSSKYKDIKVNVFQQIESVEFAKQDDIYVAIGTTYSIKADTDLNLSPIHSAKSDLRFELGEFNGVTVNEQTGVIDATNATSVGDLVLKVYGKNNPDKFDTKVVHIIKAIENDTISLADDTFTVISDGVLEVPKIELVKTIEELSYKSLELTCLDYDANLLDIQFVGYDNKVVQIDVQTGGIVMFRAVSIGSTTATLKVNLKNATDYLSPATFELPINIIDIPDGINLNGEKIVSSTSLTVYDRYNNGVMGETLRFSLVPSSVTAEDGIIVVTYLDIRTVGDIRFLKPDGSAVNVVNGTFEVQSGETLYVRASAGSSERYDFKISSPKANEYNRSIDCNLTINVLTGISDILINPTTINIEKGETTTFDLNFVPLNADVNGFELSLLSSKLNLEKLSSTSFAISGLDVTRETLYLYYKNGGYSALEINVYVPLTDFGIEVDSIYSASGIGKKEYTLDNKLNKIYVQLGSKIDLHFLYNDSATIILVEHSFSTMGICEYSNGVLTARRVGNTKLHITSVGYAPGRSGGQQLELNYTLDIETYRSISSITLNKLSDIVYDYTSVGFYNKRNLSQLDLVATVYPQNATYSNNVEWIISSENSGGEIGGSISNTTGNNTIFTAGPINSGDSETIIVTAVIREFSREFSENCVITVKKAKLVESIVLSNVANNNLYFDSRKGLNLDDESNSLTVQARAYPTDALNKNIRFSYRPLADKDGNIDLNDVTNPIFKVNSNGVVTPLRAGTAVLRVSSEDSFINATDATTFVDVYVVVADGKSKDTAFHINNADDLMSIGIDADTMSYYYVLTNNIDMSNVKNFEPIGLSNNLSFTGYLSGKYEYSSETIGGFSMKSSIVNLNIQKTLNAEDVKYGDVGEVCIGLFAKISSGRSVFAGGGYSGIPRIGTIEDLTLQVNSLKVDCSEINKLTQRCDVYIGALAGKVKVDNAYIDDRASLTSSCGIINVSVIINEFEYKVGKNNAYVGGLVGASNADIKYTTKMNAVSGNDIIILDKVKYQEAGTSGEIEFDPTYYIGGLVGENTGFIQSTFNTTTDDGEIELSALLGNEGIDVTVNINNTYKGLSYNNSLKSKNGNVGGLVGQNSGYISNASTENMIFGFYNVGGLVGTNYGGVIENSFSSSLVRGQTNVGGLIGFNAGGDVTNCYVQSYEDNKIGDLAVSVKGQTNVGGLIGSYNSGDISYVYCATYKDRKIGADRSVDYYLGDVVGETNVGSLIGNAGKRNSGDSDITLNLSFAFSNYVATDDNGISPMVGRADNLNITDSYMYIKSLDTSIRFALTASSSSYKSSYIRYIGENTNNLIIYDKLGSVTTDTNTFEHFTYKVQGNNEEKECSTLDNSVVIDSGWDTRGLADGEYPFLVYNGKRFVQEPPKQIDVEIEKCAIDDNSMLIFYYTNDDISERQILETFNIYTLANMIDITISPKSGYVNRLNVVSDNESVIQVQKEGTIKAVGIGNAKVRIVSKLSAQVYAEFEVYVSLPVLQFDVYDSINVLDENATVSYLRIKKGDNRVIKPFATANVAYKGNYISAKIAEDIVLQYEVYIGGEICYETGLNYTDFFTFENSNDAVVNGNTIGAYKDYLLSQIINAVGPTNQNSIVVHCKPYLNIGSKRVYLNEYDCKYDDNGAYSNFDTVSGKEQSFDKQFGVQVYLGATDMQFTSEENATVVAGTEVRINATLFTDDADDDVLVSILDENNKIVSSLVNSRLQSSLFNVVLEKTSPLQNNTKDYSLVIQYKKTEKAISKNTTFTIILSAESEPTVKLIYYLTLIPDNIQRIETKFYTYAEKDVLNGGVYNPYEVSSTTLIPGYNALLYVNVFPIYADYDFLELTNSVLSFEQLVKDDTRTGYPYTGLADRNYLINGITLVNAYMEGGKLVYGKNGEYYANVLASSNVKVENQTITITAYKTVNGVKTKVYTYNMPITCANIPTVELSYNGETSKNNNELYVPHGTEIEINVGLFDYTGNVDFQITTYNELNDEYITYPYASISNKTGKYILSVSSLANTGDIILLTAKISKKIGKVEVSSTDVLELIVVDYCFVDLGFENVKNNALNEVFGGSYILKLSFDNSKFFYDTTDESVKAKILDDLQALSTIDYNTWYAYKASTNKTDVSVGKYYKNAYIEVTTKSRISKDLYVSGVQYDSMDSNQKRISCKIKFSFDRATKTWVFEKSGIQNIAREDSNLTSLLKAKYLENGKIYQVLDKVFTIDFYLNTSRENAVPIYSEEDFLAMQSDVSYIQMSDLVFENFTPIMASLRSYNGNNHTITILSYKDDMPLENRSGEKRIGLFNEIVEDSIFENIHLIIGNGTVNSLDIDAVGYSEVVFGLLTSTNNGNIYNCSVSFGGERVTSATVNRVINGKEYTYPYDYAILLSDDELTSGNAIPTTATGLKVNITLKAIDNSFVVSTMGILVGENTGYITNSRIEKGVRFNGYGNIGSIAGTNSGVISSSYSKAVMYSYTSASEYSKIGGFVARNTGRISLSFVEGGFDLTNKNDVSIEINATTRVGGFVFENTGSINDCYSNVRINSNSSTAGFVFSNSGQIKNVYSTSLVRENSLQDTPFVGLDEYNRVNNTGVIEHSYFLKGNYTNQEEQPAIIVNSPSEFAEITTFDSFAFDTNINGEAVENSYSGVWFIPSSNYVYNIDGSGKEPYDGQEFIKGKPTLVSANIISRGYVDLLTVSTSGGQPEYIYTTLIGATLGSIEHPYVIYSASEFNTYILEPCRNNLTNSKYYILAKDIDFSQQAMISESYRLTFSGNFEGNGMRINKLKISYLNSNDENMSSDVKIDSLGLFKEVTNAIFKNITINVSEVYGSTAQKVGVIAGEISSSKIYGINLGGNAVVHGKNIVGAVSGVVRDSVVRDIDIELGVNAGYRSPLTYLYNDKDKSMGNKPNTELVSYAGGAIGVSIGSLVQSITISGGFVIAENTGGAIGLIDKDSIALNIAVYVKDGMFVKGNSMIGGVVSENRGTINRSFIQYEESVQDIIDASNTVGDFSTIANNTYYQLGITDSSKIDNKASTIGGLVGLNNGGKITNCYAKVNIYNTSVLVAGGIVGRSLAGEISNVYSAQTIYIGYSDTISINLDNNGTPENSTLYFKYIGGIVGVVANNIVKVKIFENAKYNGEIDEDIVALLKADSNKLTINNAVSLVTFDYRKYNEYEKDIIGGIVGLVGLIKVGSDNVCPIDNDERQVNYFNNTIYTTLTPNVKNKNHIKNYDENERIKFVGFASDKNDSSMTILGDINGVPNEQISLSCGDGYEGYEYFQMVSLGEKTIDDVYGVPEYSGKWERGGDELLAKRNVVFLYHVVSNFEFEDGDAKTPRLNSKPIASFNFEETGLFTRVENVDYEGYFLEDRTKLDLLARIVNLGLTNCANITFVLKNNIVFDINDNEFLGIGTQSNPFRGTINGNSFTISNIKLNNSTNYVGFINYANGAKLVNLAFNSVTFDIDKNSNAKYVGLVAFGSNVNINKVSMQNVSITNGCPNVTAFGVLAGSVSGAINNSYVVVNTIELNASTKIGILVNSSSGGVTISNCYTQLNPSSAIVSNGTSNWVYGIIVNCTNSSSFINTFTWLTMDSAILQGGNIQLIGYGGNHPIHDNNKYYYSVLKSQSSQPLTNFPSDISSFTNDTLYSTDSYWSGSNPWKISENGVAIWKINNGQLPMHNWDTYEPISNSGIYSDTGWLENERYFEITDPRQLENISKQLLNGQIANGGDGLLFKLESNIDLAGKDIRLGSFAVPFRGTFDGNGFTIKGLNQVTEITTNQDFSLGFFGRVDGAIIKNLNFDNCIFTVTNEDKLNDGKIYFGNVAGIANASTITDIKVTNCNVSISGKDNRLYYGGIIGYAESSTIVNCTYGKPVAQTPIDGQTAVVGLNNNPLSISLSENGIARIGGIVGYIKAQNMKVANNSVTTFDSTSGVSLNVSEDKANVGGLFGYITTTSSYSQIINNKFYSRTGQDITEYDIKGCDVEFSTTNQKIYYTSVGYAVTFDRGVGISEIFINSNKDAISGGESGTRYNYNQKAYLIVKLAADDVQYTNHAPDGFTNSSGRYYYKEYIIKDDIAIGTVNASQTINTYTVTIGVNNSEYGSISGTTITDVPYGTVISTTDNTITINGTTITATPYSPTNKYIYEFNNWTIAGTTIEGATTITANFEAIVKTFTVTIDVNNSEYGSVNVTSVENVPYDTVISATNNAINVNGTIITATPSSLTDEYNYSFTNWTNGNITITGATTITANFDRQVRKYTVTIGVNNGNYGSVDKTSVPDVPYGTVISATGNTVNINGTVVTANAGSLNGYTISFNNWTNGNIAITGATTITANFGATENSYTITFNTDGGTAIANKPYTITSADTLPSATGKTGYTFVNWKVTTAGGNWVLNTTLNSTASLTGKYGDVTLTAQWTLSTYTITVAGLENGDRLRYGYSHNSYNLYNITSNSYSGITSTYSQSGLKTLNSNLVGFERDNIGFAGLWTASSGGTKVFDDFINSIPNVTDYTDASGNWIRTSDTTLYARFSIQANVTIMGLQNGDYMHRLSYVNTSEYLDEYQDELHTTSQVLLSRYGASKFYVTYNPSGITDIFKCFTRTEYIFNGLYTLSSGGVKVVDANGNVVANVGGYTNSNGEWTKGGDTTLYAQWELVQNHVTINYPASYTYQEDISITTSGDYVVLYLDDSGSDGLMKFVIIYDNKGNQITAFETILTKLDIYKDGVFIRSVNVGEVCSDLQISIVDNTMIQLVKNS